MRGLLSTNLYLKCHYNRIIQELTDKKLIFRIGKTLTYAHDNGRSQIIALAEAKYEEKIPVLKKRSIFT